MPDIRPIAAQVVRGARCRRPEVSAEILILACALLLAVAFNTAFWRGALEGRSLLQPSTWGFLASTLTLLACGHFVLVASVATTTTVRILLAVTILAGGVTSYFIHHYGVVIDPSMIRNVLQTDRREAAELLNSGVFAAAALSLLLATLPWTVRVKRRPLRQAVFVRACALCLGLIGACVAALATYQDLSSLLRNHRELRYTITPANVVWALGRVAFVDARGVAVDRDPPEPAIRMLDSGQERKPTLLVLVVGETARAANFSLNGYARPTNPELAQLDVVNFPRAVACGTSTEVSLPCMFSPYGRADYDEGRIRRHESLLHLIARAGVRVVWLDNQSGCKGVCDGLETIDLSDAQVSGLCAEHRCYDEILRQELSRIVDGNRGDLAVVMHQLGNHGPAYFRRYPPEFKRFEPACESHELQDCTSEQIVNAYDNAIAYTDHFVAGTVRYLAGLSRSYDVALLYVSDHGESLGEHGLYLHGLPYAVAPREQIEIPMLWWFGPQAADHLRVDMRCLRRRAAHPASHDQLFHSVLGLLMVRTARYRPERDLFSACRPDAARSD